MNKQTVIALVLTLVASSAMADPAMVGDSKLGKVLTDGQGMTLYTFDKDSTGVSQCYEQCAKAWPPLQAAEGAMAAGDYSVVKREDGGMQWAYKGQPLYTWVKDSQPGDTTGDGVKGVWHVAKP